MRTERKPCDWTKLMISCVVFVVCQDVSAASPSPVASMVLPRFQPGYIREATDWAVLEYSLLFCCPFTD